MNQDALKRFALRALLRMGGQPMGADVLRDTLQLAFPSLPLGDLDRAIRDLERDGMITGTSVDLVGVVFMLTPKGQAKAAQLG